MGGFIAAIGQQQAAGATQQNAAANQTTIDPNAYQIGNAQGVNNQYAGNAAALGQAAGNSSDQTNALALSQSLANGTGPSLAKANMAAGQANVANQIASQGASNGTMGGLGARNQMNALANASGQIAGQAGVASAQEQTGNIANYGNLAQGAKNSQIGALGQQQNAVQGQAQEGQAQQNALAQQQAAQMQANGQNFGMTNSGIQAQNQVWGDVGQGLNMLATTAGSAMTGGAVKPTTGS